MSTRSNDQQKKQRQKEFLERKAHQEQLKANARKAKNASGRNKEATGETPENEA